eukprot:evm.model.scf_1733.3 EVM.evm.TU.scf_1733.3   scf_1733:25211-27132(-)
MPSCSFLMGRIVVPNKPLTLPGFGRLKVANVELPQPPHLRPLPLIPFAALPITCTIADTTSHVLLPSAETNDVAGAAIWNIPIIKALADLRTTCEELEGDPLWQYAKDGIKASRAKAHMDDNRALEDVLYEFVAILEDGGGMNDAGRRCGEGLESLQDPFAALLEFASLGLEGDPISG